MVLVGCRYITIALTPVVSVIEITLPQLMYYAVGDKSSFH